MTPSLSTSTPALVRPATTAASRNSPEARGSRPMTATGRAPLSGSRRTAAAATPRSRARRAVRSRPATPRTPSVPKRRVRDTASPIALRSLVCLLVFYDGWLDSPERGGGYRLEYWGALRAFFRPYFFRSLTRASLVRKPAFFSAGRFSGSTRVSARVTPSRSAPAWPVTPPPEIRATTSNLLSAPRVTNGSLTSCWCTLLGKYTSSDRPLICHWPEPGRMRTLAMASLRRPVPDA